MHAVTTMDGYAKAICFQSELLSLGFRPDNFLYSVKSKRHYDIITCVEYYQHAIYILPVY